MPITVTSGPAPNGTVGTPYSHTITVDGGVDPYTFTIPGFGGTNGVFSGGVYHFSMTTRAFPPGLSLHSHTGVIDGTPVFGGIFSFTITITDSVSESITYDVTITIPMVYGNNVYTLKDFVLTDDDYGTIEPYYVTYFAPTQEQEQALQLGAGRKMLAYLTAFIDACSYLNIGCNLTLTFYADTLLNPLNLTVTRTLPPNAIFDLECGGAVAQGQRIAVKFASSPREGYTDNAFNLQRLSLAMRPAVHLPVRGSAV